MRVPFSFMSVAGGGGPDEFDPGSLATVILDLDARHVTQGSGVVTEMQDQGPNGFDATSSVGEEPEYEASNSDYNGLPAVRFPGGETLHIETDSAIAAEIGTDPITVVVVGHVDDYDSGSGYFFSTMGGTALGLTANSGSIWRPVVGGDDYPTATDATVPCITVVVFNGASSRFYRNSKTAVPLTMNAHNVSDAIRLGHYASLNPVFAASGPISRFVILEGALSDGDVGTLFDGFEEIYGVEIDPFDVESNAILIYEAPDYGTVLPTTWTARYGGGAATSASAPVNASGTPDFVPSDYLQDAFNINTILNTSGDSCGMAVVDLDAIASNGGLSVWSREAIWSDPNTYCGLHLWFDAGPTYKAGFEWYSAGANIAEVTLPGATGRAVLQWKRVGGNNYIRLGSGSWSAPVAAGALGGGSTTAFPMIGLSSSAYLDGRIKFLGFYNGTAAADSAFLDALVDYADSVHP